jgi:hypothetical protein
MNPLSHGPAQVKRCWDSCICDEQKILETDHRRLLDEFEDGLVFGPLSPPVSATSSEQVVAHNYRQLVRTLRNAASREEKLRLLAMWLRQEGILQPTEFLSKEVKKKLVRATLRVFARAGSAQNRLTPRPSDLLYARVAEAWKPYFELMHHESRPPHGPHSVREKLAKLGFDSNAIAASLSASPSRLRAARESACRFAAVRLGVGEDTVVASHSRVYPSLRFK